MPKVRFERIADGSKNFRRHCSLLYQLLCERDARVNISHKEMPTYDEHVRFVKNNPYRSWWAIKDGNEYVGSVYMSRNNEIGIFILKAHRYNGFGKAALHFMRCWYKGDIYANIAPTNTESKNFFQRLGFREIQRVFKLPRSPR